MAPKPNKLILSSIPNTMHDWTVLWLPVWMRTVKWILGKMIFYISHRKQCVSALFSKQCFKGFYPYTQILQCMASGQFYRSIQDIFHIFWVQNTWVLLTVLMYSKPTNYLGPLFPASFLAKIHVFNFFYCAFCYQFSLYIWLKALEVYMV